MPAKTGMYKHGKTIRAITTCIVTVAAIVAIIALHTARPGSYMPSLEGAPDVSDWLLDGPHIYPGFHWSSDDKLIYPRQDTFETRPSFTFIETDNKGLMPRPLTALSKVFVRHTGMYTRARLSPNGRRMLWNSDSVVFSCGIDGNGFNRWDSELITGYGLPTWSIDGSRWFKLKYVRGGFSGRELADGIVEVDAQHPQNSKIITLNGPISCTDEAEVFQAANGSFLVMDVCNGQNKVDRGLKSSITLLKPNGDGLALVARYDLARNNSTSGAIELAPDGTRIAWVEWSEHSDLLSKLRRFFNHSAKLSTVIETKLVVSDLSGHNREAVADVVETATPGNVMPEAIDQIRWLPASDRISFVYDGSLCTLPVHR